jgi:hypothetical protein
MKNPDRNTTDDNGDEYTFAQDMVGELAALYLKNGFEAGRPIEIPSLNLRIQKIDRETKTFNM